MVGLNNPPPMTNETSGSTFLYGLGVGLGIYCGYKIFDYFYKWDMMKTFKGVKILKYSINDYQILIPDDYPPELLAEIKKDPIAYIVKCGYKEASKSRIR